MRGIKAKARKIKRRVLRPWQRLRRGWSLQDTWAIDYYLDTIIPDMVDALRERSFGHPSELIEDDWNQILRQISSGFRSHKKLLNVDFETPAEVMSLETDFERGMELFVKWYDALWD